MTGRPVAARRPGRMRRARARAWRLVTALLGVPRIATARRVRSRYNAASGPLLARGLAFTTLFMLVPALLLIASIAGLVGGDLERRARIVDFLVAQFPPLVDLLKRALDTALAHAGAFTAIGAVILAWSASSLVRDLDRAFGTIFRQAGTGPTMLRMIGEVAGRGCRAWIPSRADGRAGGGACGRRPGSALAAAAATAEARVRREGQTAGDACLDADRPRGARRSGAEDVVVRRGPYR